MSEQEWRQDPTGRHQHRLWRDGEWTEHVSDNGQTGTDPYEIEESASGGWKDKARAAAKKSAELAAQGVEAAQERRASNQLAAAEAVASGSRPLLSVKSHDDGRNADVIVYTDRVERVQERSRMSVGRSKQETEVIPMRSISSVQTKKDGFRYSKVTVHATGNPIDFRLAHDDAVRMKEVITDLILGKHNPAPAAAPSPAPAPQPAAPAPEVDVIGKLKELAELRDAGILTDDEFAAQKAKLLS